MPSRAFLRRYRVTIAGAPFLKRLIIWFSPSWGIVITRICAPDDQRPHPHDHSASFWSWRLLGSYCEDVYDDPDDLSRVTRRQHRWLSASVLRHDRAHSVTSISRFPLVTVLVTGKRRQHPSYWTPEGKVPTGMMKE
jgi:hypothetical protein